MLGSGFHLESISAVFNRAYEWTHPEIIGFLIAMTPRSSMQNTVKNGIYILAVKAAEAEDFEQ